MSSRSSDDQDWADFWKATAMVVAFIVIIAGLWTVLALSGLSFRPFWMQVQREQNVQSQQNVDAQRTIIGQQMQDYARQEQVVANLKASGAPDTDPRVVNARGVEKADVEYAHQQLDALPNGDASVLPKDQQQWLAAHP